MVYIFYISSCFILCSFLFFLNYMMSEGSYVNLSREESSSYECGFEHNSLSRVPFSIRYFLLTIVFLVFDMEIILLMFTPFSSFLSLGDSLSIIIILVFIIILFLGLFYEWLDGSLDWVL